MFRTAVGGGADAHAPPHSAYTQTDPHCVQEPIDPLLLPLPLPLLAPLPLPLPPPLPLLPAMPLLLPLPLLLAVPLLAPLPLLDPELSVPESGPLCTCPLQAMAIATTDVTAAAPAMRAPMTRQTIARPGRAPPRTQAE